MHSKEAVHLPQNIEKSNNQLSFGEVIQKYRILAKLNQAELADLVGVSRATVNNWENNKNRPDQLAIKNLAELIGLPLYELFGVSHAPLPSPYENTMLNQFRQLSSVGQNVVFNMIGNMLKEELNEQSNIMKDTFSILPLEMTPAAAGEGCNFSDIPPKPFFFKSTHFNRSADRIIRISGNSMLPDYHDGDLVYVKDTSSANNYDIVVASYHNGLVIKRCIHGRLYSLNNDLPFGEKYEDDNIRIVGKVVGIVDSNDTPSKDEEQLLHEVFSRELKNFYAEYGE